MLRSLLKIATANRLRMNYEFPVPVFSLTSSALTSPTLAFEWDDIAGAIGFIAVSLNLES
jgi:hypothetical protein